MARPSPLTLILTLHEGVAVSRADCGTISKLSIVVCTRGPHSAILLHHDAVIVACRHALHAVENRDLERTPCMSAGLVPRDPHAAIILQCDAEHGSCGHCFHATRDHFREHCCLLEHAPGCSGTRMSELTIVVGTCGPQTSVLHQHYAMHVACCHSCCTA